MKDLYTFNKNSNHVKFFKWMWGVDPTISFKTMCPYFWQFLGSIVILPLILLWKLAILLTSPIKELIDAHSEKQADKFIAELLERIRSASTEEDYYNIYKSRCYRNYSYGLDYDEVCSLGSKYRGYLDLLEKRKADRQRALDNFKYGKSGTILSYVIGLVVVLLVGWFIYWLLHLFTWSEFLDFIISLGVILIFITVAVGSYFSFKYLVDRYWCDNWINKIVFWKYVGVFFKAIWKGIVMTIDMIKNIYKKSCPIITWENN